MRGGSCSGAGQRPDTPLPPGSGHFLPRQESTPGRAVPGPGCLFPGPGPADRLARNQARKSSHCAASRRGRRAHKSRHHLAARGAWPALHPGFGRCSSPVASRPAVLLAQHRSPAASRTDFSSGGKATRVSLPHPAAARKTTVWPVELPCLQTRESRAPGPAATLQSRSNARAAPLPGRFPNPAQCARGSTDLAGFQARGGPARDAVCHRF